MDNLKKLPRSSKYKKEMDSYKKTVKNSISKNREILRKEHAKSPENRKTISRVDVKDFTKPTKPGRPKRRQGE